MVNWWIDTHVSCEDGVTEFNVQWTNCRVQILMTENLVGGTLVKRYIWHVCWWIKYKQCIEQVGNMNLQVSLVRPLIMIGDWGNLLLSLVLLEMTIANEVVLTLLSVIMRWILLAHGFSCYSPNHVNLVSLSSCLIKMNK